MTWIILDVAVFPTALHINEVKAKLNNKSIIVGAQNISKTNLGAFTGEIAAEMLVDNGIQWTLVGHSERRTLYGETDEVTKDKVNVGQAKGLKICFCIGEKIDEREAGKTNEVCFRQLNAIISDVKKWEDIVIAYEPVWAIGTGKVATTEQAQEAHKAIRDYVGQKVSKDVADKIRIVYGGSVTAGNCAELIKMTDIDGFLVGGASLKPEFANIIEAAASK